MWGFLPVNKTLMVLGLAFLVLGGYALYVGARISSAFALAIGIILSVYSLMIPSEKQIKRSLQKGVVSGFLDLGKKKIENGTVKVDYDKFKEVVETLKPIISDLPTMPELGYDSIYLHYPGEGDAENALENIQKLSLEASLVPDKSEWAVKIDIPDGRKED